MNGFKGDGKALAGSFSHWFCGEKGVKHLVLNFWGNTGAGILNADFNMLALGSCADPDFSQLAVFF